jgi:3-hydroxyisobutyrate dehydrogenase-like beta-hydroxyacid dehydrogenase
VVLTMLSDDGALEAVTHGDEGVLAGLPSGGLHVSMSTISLALSDRLAEDHAQRGQAYVSAPVFGRPPAAEAAKLFIAAAGAEGDIARAQPLFDALGQRTFVVGDRPSAANIVKLAGNFMIMSTIETLAQAMTVAGKAGVEKGAFLEVMTSTLFSAPVYRTYGDILVSGAYRPAGFAAPLGLKDMRLVGQAAETLRAPMPFLGVIRDHLLQIIAAEGEDIDWSAAGLAVERNAGV